MAKVSKGQLHAYYNDELVLIVIDIYSDNYSVFAKSRCIKLWFLHVISIFPLLSRLCTYSMKKFSPNKTITEISHLMHLQLV